MEKAGEKSCRVVDYIADFLADHGICDCFMITGGGAMHLNDALGHHDRIRCVYHHHEQACAVAAEGYARVTGNPAAVCVTSGPGGTNAITGVMGAWLDSIPMIVISGQVKQETTIWSCPDVDLRQLGDQEFDIIHSVANMTKYTVMLTEPEETAFHLEKALSRAVSGRPGPVWIDVPLDVQGAVIDPGKLLHWEGDEHGRTVSPVTADLQEKPVPEISGETVREVLGRIREAEAPLLLVGTGIHLAGGEKLLAEVLNRLKIPAVTAWNANDLVAFDSPWFAGMPGTVGTRSGNFALQSCDLLLSLGCRMNIRMVGYTPFDFGKNAFRIAVDIDENELKKPTLDLDLAIHGEVGEFMEKLLEQMDREEPESTSPESAAPEEDSERAAAPEERDGPAELVTESADGPAERHARWLAWCRDNLRRYPALAEVRRSDSPGTVNPYRFIDRLFELLGDGDTVVCSNGSACVVTFQAARVKAGQRMFTNSGCASMGYGLPASIGAAVALRAPAEGKAGQGTPGRDTSGRRGRVICIEGDGSLMMNLQELASAAHNQMDIKVFLLNNGGYHSIRQTQRNHFRPPFVGIDPESGVGFPDWKQTAHAFGLKYLRIDGKDGMEEVIGRMLETDGPALCEVIVDPEQEFVPKTSSRVLEDGRIVSAALEDMAPFLSREELENALFRRKGLK